MTHMQNEKINKLPFCASAFPFGLQQYHKYSLSQPYAYQHTSTSTHTLPPRVVAYIFFTNGGRKKTLQLVANIWCCGHAGPQ